MNYKNKEILLTTIHKKGQAIAPAVLKILEAKIKIADINTDQLGTFSGEIARVGSQKEVLEKKCMMGLAHFKHNLGIANEGSFGPHPYIPFIACNIEMMIFIDLENDLKIYESLLSTKTNYSHLETDDFAELVEFAKKCQFPSHALIIRSAIWEDKKIIFKGIQDEEILKNAFLTSCIISPNKKAWIETDMRAHMNPTRMVVISELAEKLCLKIKTLCPACSAPGWGKSDVELGLECELCGSETELVKYEIFACVKCEHKEKRPRNDSKEYALPSECNYCNP